MPRNKEDGDESRLGTGRESLAAERFAAAMELFDSGRAEQVQQRLAELSDDQECDEFLRKSPERFRKLKVGQQR